MSRPPHAPSETYLRELIKAVTGPWPEQNLINNEIRWVTWSDLERPAVKALARVIAAGSSRPDGFPRRASGASSIGSVGGAPPRIAELGDDHVDLTPVEAAASAREKAKEDELQRTLVKFLDKLKVAAAVMPDLRSLGNQLIKHQNELDDLRSGKGKTKSPRTCEACTGHRRRQRGDDNPIAHTGTVGDRLEHPLGLCDHCHNFVERSAKAGSRQGRPPNHVDILHHEDTGRWRIKLAPQQQAS